MPEASLIAFGLFGGIPAGALTALSAQAITSDNRGPGLGIFYPWHYVGMTLAPAVLAAAMLTTVAFLAGIFRIMQASWSIKQMTPNAAGTM